jgi:hypothetical protein
MFTKFTRKIFKKKLNVPLYFHDLYRKKLYKFEIENYVRSMGTTYFKIVKNSTIDELNNTYKIRIGNTVQNMTPLQFADYIQSQEFRYYILQKLQNRPSIENFHLQKTPPPPPPSSRSRSLSRSLSQPRTPRVTPIHTMTYLVDRYTLNNKISKKYTSVNSCKDLFIQLIVVSDVYTYFNKRPNVPFEELNMEYMIDIIRRIKLSRYFYKNSIVASTQNEEDIYRKGMTTLVFLYWYTGVRDYTTSLQLNYLLRNMDFYDRDIHEYVRAQGFNNVLQYVETYEPKQLYYPIDIDLCMEYIHNVDTEHTASPYGIYQIYHPNISREYSISPLMGGKKYKYKKTLKRKK